VELDEIQRLKASSLKQLFGVFGYFYDRASSDGVLPCREVLEIIDIRDTPYDFNDLLCRQPELVTIMMNPGSSKPVSDSYKPVLVNNDNGIVINRHLVETQPDNAQYQIMRLMLIRNWRHCRILNLSDLREPKSQLFMGLWPQLEWAHTLFAPERRSSLKELVGTPERVLLA
jgi:hypothetical protein